MASASFGGRIRRISERFIVETVYQEDVRKGGSPLPNKKTSVTGC